MPSHYLDDPAPGARPLRPLGPSDPQLIGPYRLLGVLGTGGMGRVYLGHSQTGKRVAIKVIRGELAEDPAFRQRFAREVAIARTVSALYTAPVVDFDPDADPPWFATTYIEGPSLASLVRNHGPLAPQTVFTLAAGLAEALAGLHQAGFAHRDLKPANVLLTDVGPYVIDFGVAMPENATRLTSGVVLGTPGFMAPELIEGERGSPASDIFSLGATLVFAATGHGVVKGDNLAAQLVQMTRGRYDLAEVPAGLRPLIIRCLARNAKDRPTAGEIARTLVGAGVVAPGPGWFGAAWPIDAGTAGLSRVPRHVSRRRLLLGAAGLTGLVLAVGAWRSLSGGTAVNAARQGRQLWQATVNSDGRFRLLAGSARVVVPCDDGSTVAVDHGTGQQRWFSTDRACDLAGATALVVGVPAVGGTTDGPDPVEPPGVGLVHLEDGTVAVRVPLDPSRYGQFRQARATGNGVLLVFAGAVLALDGAGKRQWEWRPDPGTAVVRAAPLSIGALVVLEPADRQRSEVWLVVIEGGAEVRRWAPASEDGALPGDEVGAVLVSGERAIVLAASWQLAVEPDLSPLWLHRHRLPTDDHHLFHDRVVQAAGRIIVPDRGRVWAIADSDGEVAWTTPIGAGATLAAARPDGRTYVVAGGALHELTEQGEVVWRADLPDPVERSLPAALAVDEYAGYLLVRESGAERVPLSANLLALTLD